MDGSIATGNKLLFNTALVRFHGKPRNRHSRLFSTVYQGYKTALVESGLDWVAGDRLYFAPTNHQWMHSEYRTVVDYISSTGLITLDEPFSFYHYGDDISSASRYNGVDIRGEVRLLTRNVRIVGHENDDEWGGHVLTTDRMEFDGSNRHGTTIFDYVEVENCS